MSKTKNFFAVFVLLLFIGVVSCDRNNLEEYAYPGNGIPILAKNKRMKALERDLVNYSKFFPNTGITDSKIRFSKVKGFRFESPRVICKEEFFFEVTVEPLEGEFDLGLGNVHINLKERKVCIKKKGAEVYSSQLKKQGKIEIAFFSFSDTRQSITIFSDDRSLNDIIYVNFSRPAKITLKLEDNFSGEVGPWVWLRGFK